LRVYIPNNFLVVVPKNIFPEGIKQKYLKLLLGRGRIYRYLKLSSDRGVYYMWKQEVKLPRSEYMRTISLHRRGPPFFYRHSIGEEYKEAKKTGSDVYYDLNRR